MISDGHYNVFGPTEREAFRQLVRAQPLDERLAADTAHALARQWAAHFTRPTDDAPLPDCLEHKIAGYNANLHEWTRRALRAIAAADQWAAVHAGTLHHALPDLLIGEYFLIQRLLTTGGSVTSTTPLPILIRALAQSTPSQLSTPNYDPIEIDLTRAAPSTLPLPHAPTWFIATMNNYLNPMIPVMERLLAQGQPVALLAPQSASTWSNWKRLPAALETATFESLTSDHTRAILADSPPPTPPILLDHIDLSPFLSTDLAHITRTYIPHTRAYAAIGRRLVQYCGARTIITARLRRASETAISLAAQRAGAKLLLLIHGHISALPQRRCTDGSFHHANAIAAWGPAHSRLLLAKNENIAPNQIIETGNPDWDRLTPLNTKANRAAARRRVAHALNLHSPVLITCTSQAEASSQIPDIARAALTPPNTDLIIKAHPAEDPSSYLNQIPAHLHSRVRIMKDANPPLHDLLLASDALITFHSTTNIEALLLGTPVISAALGHLATADRLIPLEPYALPLATTREELQSHISRLAADPAAYRSSLHDAIRRACDDIAKPDGDATTRVCDLITNFTACRSQLALHASQA